MQKVLYAWRRKRINGDVEMKKNWDEYEVANRVGWVIQHKRSKLVYAAFPNKEMAEHYLKVKQGYNYIKNTSEDNKFI